MKLVSRKAFIDWSHEEAGTQKQLEYLENVLGIGNFVSENGDAISYVYGKLRRLTDENQGFCFFTLWSITEDTFLKLFSDDGNYTKLYLAKKGRITNENAGKIFKCKLKIDNSVDLSRDQTPVSVSFARVINNINAVVAEVMDELITPEDIKINKVDLIYDENGLPLYTVGQLAENMLENACEQKKNKYAEIIQRTQEEKDSILDELTQAKEEQLQAERVMTELKNEKGKLEKEIEKDKKALADLKKQIVEKEKGLKAELSAKEKQHKQELAEQTKKHKQELAEKEKQHKQDLAEQTKQHKADLAIKEKELKEAPKKLETELKKIQKKYVDDLEKEAQKFEQALKERKAEIAKKYEAQEHAVAELEKQYYQYRDELRNNGFSINLPDIGEKDIFESQLTEAEHDAQKNLQADAKELTDYVWKYIWTKKDINLQYDRSVIDRFISALHTEQMTILWGTPGSGKTSLPEAVAKAIGAECSVISVQPNWTDNQDLLGYYHGVEKRYFMTQFLNCISRAAQEPQRLHIIVLDEMNLAHVEYYFSAILSAMTTDKKEIHLYTPQKNMDITEVGILPMVQIPSNVRFVGTLNMDGTTKDISPKVIDRSYVMQVARLSKEDKVKQSEWIDEIEIDNLKEMRLLVEADSFSCKKGISKLDEESNKNSLDKILSKIEAAKELLGELYEPSYRFDVYAKQLFLWNKELDMDQLIVDKILVNIKLDQENVKLAEKVWQSINANSFPKVKEKMEGMIQQVEKYDESYYWGN